MGRLIQVLVGLAFLLLRIGSSAAAPLGPDVGDANAAPILAFCDENESHAIQIAWASAQLSLLQANLAINLAVFDAFFAPSTFPGPEGMSEFLSNISTQKPLNDGPQPLRPAIVCAKGNIFQEIFPLVPADLASACLDPAKPNRYFTMVGKGSYHAVFLCGSKFFSLPGSVEPAGENNCPAVRGNMFVNEGGFPLAQSMLLVIGMMNLYRNIRMQNSINMWIQLNPALQNRERPRGANVVLFVFMAAYGCKSVPNVRLPPWKPGVTCPTTGGIELTADWSIEGPSTALREGDGGMSLLVSMDLVCLAHGTIASA